MSPRGQLPVRQWLQTVHAADLLLAVASLAAEPVALFEVQSRIERACARVASRMGLASDAAAEIAQALASTFLGEGRFSEYSGRSVAGAPGA